MPTKATHANIQQKVSSAWNKTIIKLHGYAVMKKYVMSMSRLKPSSFRGMAASWTILCHLDLSSADHSKSSLLKPGHLIFPAYCWSSSITVPLSVPCIIPFFKQPSFCNMCGCHATTSECYTDSHENQKQ